MCGHKWDAERIKLLMDRRKFLTAAGTLALGQWLTGCAGQNQQVLKIRLLKNSIPARWLKEFRQQPDTRDVRLDFTPTSQLSELFQLLQTWKRQGTQATSPSPISLPFLNGNQTAPLADLVTLGDYWLAKAIQQGLIQPLALTELSNWQQLPEIWQTLVRRDQQGNLDPAGQIWAAPYRWGTTVMAYRADKFRDLGWTPTDWSDLWRSPIKGRIALLDQPREVMGLTLKKLGKSYNTADLNTVASLEAELSALHQQVRFYSSDTYLQPLVLGDVWLAVGWSRDVLALMRRNPDIKAVVPRSGTALWADVWVNPSGSARQNLPLVEQWINFGWQTEPATQLSLLNQAASPVLMEEKRRASLPAALQTNALLLPDPQVLQRSEFLAPLSETAIAQYRALWLKIRQSNS